ncbi:MAG: exodeoxyribonuclease III [Proteobacteria bacterium]|nr:exodeoxyribonuclease III [Pseudomonadota bacterium]
MKITTWNVNSVRLRLPLIEKFIAKMEPDVLCLQETKVVDDLFPAEAFANLGYTHQKFAGMKSYNGVAILSKLPFSTSGKMDWVGKEDCRHVEVTLDGGPEIHNFYIPAGGDVPDPAENDKFAHKLGFIDEMTTWSAGLKGGKKKRIILGDFNIAPSEADVWSHKQLLKVVSHTPIEVDRLAALAKAGDWIDAVRHLSSEDEKLFSWWSYRARDWTAADRGRRLDHIWVSPALKGSLEFVDILREARGWETPSDHVPVTLKLR